jgi:hypothetical protein
MVIFFNRCIFLFYFFYLSTHTDLQLFSARSVSLVLVFGDKLTVRKAAFITILNTTYVVR